MPELSPAAAILAAFRERYDETLRPGPFVGRWQAKCLAEALDALADQVVPKPATPHDSCCDVLQEHFHSKILAIAAELRGGQADG